MFFIVNKFARNGQCHKIFTKKILPILKKKSPNFGFKITSSRKEAITTARKLVARKEEIVVACGGDGTANALIQPLSDAETALGILPLGSANDFALASLGMPMNPTKALYSLLDGMATMVDVGIVENIPFLNVFGIGMDASITHLAHKHPIFRRMPLKELRYGFPLIQELQNPLSLKVKITADNQFVFEGNVFFLNIYNGKREGAYFYLNDRGNISDGILNGVVIENLNFQQRLYYLIKIMRGDLNGLPALHQFQGKVIEITVLNPKKEIINGQVDGGPIFFKSGQSSTTLTITNRHEVLHVIGPRI